METNEVKKTRKEKKQNEASRFLVKTKGYRETFNTIDKAKNQFEILKKRAIKGKKKVKIELFEKESNNNLILVDEVSITEFFFEED